MTSMMNKQRVDGRVVQPNTPLLEFRGVGRDFRKGSSVVPVLRDIDLSVNGLEFLCLVGESGCGKTTSGKILSGLLSPTAGQVLFEGQNVSTLHGEAYTRYRRAVQIIHQDPYASLNPTQSVFDIMSYPLLRHGFAKNRKAARVRAEELLELVGLTPTADIIGKYPHQLSGGQRQRVSIARALTTEPKVIVADEAVSMVDVSIRISILNTLMKMRETLSLTIVFITHDLALAKYFAWEGRIAVMYLGRVVEVGPTREVTERPQHPYTKTLLTAIPEPDPDRTRHKEILTLRSEDVPSLTALPAGCTFHPRCPFFEPGRCDTREPELGGVSGSDAQVACIPLTEGDSLEPYKADLDGAAPRVR